MRHLAEGGRSPGGRNRARQRGSARRTGSSSTGNPAERSIVRLDTVQCLTDSACRTNLAANATSWIWPKWMMLLILVQCTRQAPSGKRDHASSPAVRCYWTSPGSYIQPNPLVDAPAERARRRWSAGARAAIALELVIPLGLLAPMPWFTAAIAGAGMHLRSPPSCPRS